MAKKQIEHFIGTYANIILSDWQTLAQYIANNSSEQTVHSLSREQIDDALNGPLGAFFRVKMTAFAKLGRQLHELNLLKEDAYKEVHDNSFTKKTGAELEELMKRLNTLTEGHYKQWQLNWENWCDYLIKKTIEADVPLNEIEVNAFKEKEGLFSLLKRYQELSLELPKSKIATMNFEKYLYYKLNLAIQSALSRLHKPNSQADIDKIMKKLKSDFKAVASSEKQLLDTQLEETRLLIGEN